MGKAVLISIRPEWVNKIITGEKTLEVRKTRPRLETPFKCYIYCSNPGDIALWKARSHFYTDKHHHSYFDQCWVSSIVGEFVCDRIELIVPTLEPYGTYDVDDDFVVQTGLVNSALWDYGNGATLYGWHISGLEIYDTPKTLAEFTGLRETRFGVEPVEIKRPPQSWCYVEELSNG